MNTEKIIILGAGRVGIAIAEDLYKDYKVTVADSDPERLRDLKERYKIGTIQCDLSDTFTLKQNIEKYDLVVGAMPGFMGFESLKNTIEAGKNVVDISFFPEDPFELDMLAKNKNVTAVIDCGVAPGLSNIILGYHNVHMDVQNFQCFVGGLPFKRLKPFEYKAPFSPVDVIEEYTRPARVVVEGKLKIKPALSDLESVNINPVGTLEAFNTDGLRTLLKTMKIPNMTEKTLRYPGHAEAIELLKEAGFFEKQKSEINGIWISPLDFTSNLLFTSWKYEKDEPEFTVMQITVDGRENGVLKRFKYTIYDKFDEVKKISSMARTTGYTCAAAARLVLKGNFTKKGISPPEYIGAFDKCYPAILGSLKSHNIRFELEETIL